MHKIRLRGPWEIRPLEPDASSGDGAARLQMPCSLVQLLEKTGVASSRFVLTRRFGRPASLSVDETVKLCLTLSPDCRFCVSPDGDSVGVSIVEMCYNEAVLPFGDSRQSSRNWIITDRLLPRNALEMTVALPRQASISQSGSPIFEVWLEIT